MPSHSAKDVTTGRSAKLDRSETPENRAHIPTSDLVRATSALFIAVYILAVVSGVRILVGRARAAAISALAFVAALAVFSAGFLAVPAAVGGGTVVLLRALRRQRVGFSGSAAANSQVRG